MKPVWRQFLPQVAVILAWALASWLPGAPGGIIASWYRLSLGFLLFSPCFVILQSLCPRNRSPWVNALGSILVLSAVLSGLALFNGRSSPDMSLAGDVFLVALALGGLLLAGFATERLWLGDRTHGLITLGVGTLVLLSPFALNSVLSSAFPPETIASIRDKALCLSPLVATASALDLDLFKLSGIYRRCLVGETIFRYPEPRESARALLLLAASWFMIATTGGWAGRRFAALWRQMAPGKPRS